MIKTSQDMIGIFSLFVVILFSMTHVKASEYSVKQALLSYGLEKPIVVISDNAVQVDYFQKIAEFSTLDEEAKRVAEISKIVSGIESAYSLVILRQIFDDAQIMEFKINKKDAAVFLSGKMTTNDFMNRVNTRVLTRGLYIIPERCEPDQGDNCQNSRACSCYPNETCNLESNSKDMRGCTIKKIPKNAYLYGSEYICNKKYIWNKENTDCILDVSVAVDIDFKDALGKPCGTNHEYIRSLFQSILERDVDPALGSDQGEMHLLNFENGMSRENVILHFFHSLEYIGKEKNSREFLRDTYQSVLGREPSLSELSDLPSEKNDQLISMLFNSREYTDLIANCIPISSGIENIYPIADSHVYAYSYRNWNKANWGKHETLGAGWHPGGGEKRAYLKFDLSGVDPESVVKATLKLFHNHTGGNSSLDLGLHEVSSEWKEGTGTYHSGQTEKPAISGEISWVNQPEFDSHPIVQFNPGSEINDWVEVDITSLVKSWLSGKPNHGLMIKAEGRLISSTKPSVYGFYSREYKDSKKHPMLILSTSQEPDKKVFTKSPVIACGENKVFVKSLYHSIFEREPTNEEITEYINKLENGVLRGTLVQNFLMKIEMLEGLGWKDKNFIVDAYQAIYSREPTVSEIKAWSGSNRSIVSVTNRSNTIDEMFRSREHLDLIEDCAPLWHEPSVHKGSLNTIEALCGTDKEFIFSLFQSVLERDPKKKEVDHQVNNLKNGMSRKDMIIRFFKFGEYLHKKKGGSEAYRDAYQAVLGREPSAEEIQTFPRTYPYMMAIQLFDTDEYRNLCSNQEDHDETNNEKTDTATEKEAYERYIAAYNKLTQLMAEKKGDTPEAERAFEKYKYEKKRYEKIIKDKKPVVDTETKAEKKIDNLSADTNISIEEVYKKYIAAYKKLTKMATKTPISDPPELKKISDKYLKTLGEYNRTQDRRMYQEYIAAHNHLMSMVSKVKITAPPGLKQVQDDYFLLKAEYERKIKR